MTRTEQRTLRSKRQRALLWYAADGKCQRCGGLLGDDWEADHIVPWVKTQRTNLFEMQALCRKCNRKKGMQHMSWQQYFKLHSDFREQSGQIKAFELAASVMPQDTTIVSWLFQLVTGYGKTLVAYGVFSILSQRGLVDRMLVLVPSDDQRTQFADDVKDAQDMLGIDLEAWVIEKAGREHTIVRSGVCQVFVATYQQLEEGGFFHDLMDYGGRWLVVSDECHHLGEDGKWAARHEKLPHVRFRIGLSATPIRSDLKRLLGLPEHPQVRVDYQEAFKEQVVKRVLGRIDHYYLDVDIDGTLVRLTTESLREQGIADFSQYEARRQLRYNTNYLHQMLIEPLQDLATRNERYPKENQMILFCMTCRHAHYVCDQINALCIDLDMPHRAEWVGVGEGIDGLVKTSEENRSIIKRFKAGTLQILVQVAKAEEGFNVKRVSVLVFLHLIGADLKIIQQIGRGLRRNPAIKLFRDDTVTVYASADTPIADIIQQMETKAEEVMPRTREERMLSQLGLWDIPNLMLIDANYDRTDMICPDGIDILTPEQRAFCGRFNIPVDEYLNHFGGMAPHPNERSAPRMPNPQARLKAVEEQVVNHTRTLTGNIIRLMKANGHPIDKAAVGRVKTSINVEWKRRAGIGHGDMTTDAFTRKNQWLQSVNESIKQSMEIPSWVKW